METVKGAVKVEETSRPRPVSKGRDGVGEMIGVVMNSLRNRLPTIQKIDESGHSIEDRMIKSIDEIVFVPPAQFPKLEEADNPAKDSFLFKALRYAGIPEPTLRTLMYHSNISMYRNPYTPFMEKDDHDEDHGEHYKQVTKAFLSEDYLDSFASENIADRTLAALRFGMNLALLNLKLAPKPLEISDPLKTEARIFLSAIANAVTSSMASVYSKEVSSKTFEVGRRASFAKIEVARRFILNLINREGEDYSPRVVAFGAKLLLVLPHQGLANAEVVTSGSIDLDMRFRFVRLTLDDIIDYLWTSIGKKAHELKSEERDGTFEDLLPGFKAGFLRAEDMADLLKVRNLRSSFHDYTESRIPILLAEAKRGGLSLMNLL